MASTSKHLGFRCDRKDIFQATTTGHGSKPPELRVDQQTWAYRVLQKRQKKCEKVHIYIIYLYHCFNRILLKSISWALHGAADAAIFGSFFWGGFLQYSPPKACKFRMWFPSRSGSLPKSQNVGRSPTDGASETHQTDGCRQWGGSGWRFMIVPYFCGGWKWGTFNSRFNPNFSYILIIPEFLHFPSMILGICFIKVDVFTHFCYEKPGFFPFFCQVLPGFMTPRRSRSSQLPSFQDLSELLLARRAMMSSRMWLKPNCTGTIDMEHCDCWECWDGDGSKARNMRKIMRLGRSHVFLFFICFLLFFIAVILIWPIPKHRKIFTLAMACRSNKSPIDAEKIAAALVSLFSFCFTNVRWLTFLVCFMMFFHLHFWACHWSRFYVSGHFFLCWKDSVSCWLYSCFDWFSSRKKWYHKYGCFLPFWSWFPFEVVVRSVFWVT